MRCTSQSPSLVRTDSDVARLRNVPSSARRLSWILAGCLAVACGLNPQPDLPVTNDSGSAPGGTPTLGGAKSTAGSPSINLGGTSGAGTASPGGGANGEASGGAATTMDDAGGDSSGGGEAGAAGQSALSNGGSD